MLQKRVSVIVPVYNAASYLRKCVDSIIGQSYADLDIVLVDDGATDESPSICDEYAAKDNRVQVIHKKNGGLMSAWMAGVEKAVGEYLCFVDSDDWIDFCMVEELIERSKGCSGEVVCCNFVIEKETGQTYQRHQLKAGVYEGEVLAEVKKNLLGNENRIVSFSRCMKLISKELYENNIKFCNPQIKMGEDVNIMLPVLLDTKRLVIMEDAFFYHYYFNQSSMVHKYDAALYHNIQMLRTVINEVITGKDNRDEEKTALYQRADMEYIYLLMLAVKNEARGNKKGYYENIKKICLDADSKKIIRSTSVKIKEKANQLIYLTMKHPNIVTISLLRMAMIWYYRK